MLSNSIYIPTRGPDYLPFRPHSASFPDSLPLPLTIPLPSHAPFPYSTTLPSVLHAPSAPRRRRRHRPSYPFLKWGSPQIECQRGSSSIRHGGPHPLLVLNNDNDTHPAPTSTVTAHDGNFPPRRGASLGRPKGGRD